MNFYVRIAMMTGAAFAGVTAPVQGQASAPEKIARWVAPEAAVSVGLAVDFLALHAEITFPEGTTSVQYRWSEAGPIPADAPWIDTPVPSGMDRVVKVEVQLAKSRWAEFQARALKGSEVLSTSARRHKPRAFTLVTPAWIAGLPEAERDRWQAYLDQSARWSASEFDALAAECRAEKLPKSLPAPAGGRWEVDLDAPPEWFKGEEARQLAETVMSFQTPAGGWSKAISYREGLRRPAMHWTTNAGDPWHYCGTLDNRATTTQLRFLAAFYTATRREEAKDAVQRGLEWLLAAQFPNGGWPQNYPLEPGYHEAITLNDDAMTSALKIAHDVSRGAEPFAFVDEPLRRRLDVAFERGLQCLSAAQVVMDGRRTVWGAQHHPITLRPAAARRMEPVALSGGESAELLRFLMREGPATPEVATMVGPALTWLDAHRVTGWKAVVENRKTTYVADPESKEVYWARFYDPVTAQPIFPGWEDGVIYSSYSEMAAKNKVGYDYFVTRPGELLDKEFPRWRNRMAEAGVVIPELAGETKAPSR